MPSFRFYFNGDFLTEEMAESVGRPSKIVLDRIKLLFGDKYPTRDEDKMSPKNEGEKCKLHRQLSRSKSGRIKHRVRHYSSISEVDFYPPAIENNDEKEDEILRVDVESIINVHSDKSKLKPELFRDVTKNSGIEN